MAERDRAAVDVHLVLVHAEHAHGVEGNRGESLVDLEQVDVIDREARLLEGLLSGVGGRPGQVGKLVRHRGLGHHRGQRLAPVALCPLLAGEHQGAGAVVHARGIAGGVVALLVERPGQRGQLLERRLPARALIDLDGRVALLRLHRDRHDLLGQPALVRGFDGQLVGAERKAVHVRARDLELLADLVGLLAHVLAAERVGEAILDHAVERLGVAHAVAEAGVVEQVGRLRHRLHAPRHGHVEVAGPHGLLHDPRRAQA